MILTLPTLTNNIKDNKFLINKKKTRVIEFFYNINLIIACDSLIIDDVVLADPGETRIISAIIGKCIKIAIIPIYTYITAFLILN